MTDLQCLPIRYLYTHKFYFWSLVVA